MDPSRCCVDVLMLSYCKSRQEYQMTRQCLRSLEESESGIDFRVVVVETNSRQALYDLSGGELLGTACQVVFPEKPFHYNQFLQIGYRALGRGQAEYLFIVNNDLLFESGFASELIDALRYFDSTTPWCPGFHDYRFAGYAPYYPGYRPTWEVCGWALMVRKSVFNHIPFAELFSDDFGFWYQDNYFAFQLERHGLRHALVRAAKVHHLFEQSHRLLEPARREELTRNAETAFRKKTYEVSAAEGWPLLTVAIPTITTRVSSGFPVIVDKLNRQAQGRPVEILALLDNRSMSLGAKRNALAGLAQGLYLVYVDDDDDVADDYVPSLLDATHRDPAVDCIVFDAWVTINGQPDRICKYGVEYEDVNTPQAYFRRPNHICCFRSELARTHPREDIGFGEDFRWAALVHGDIRRQTRIDQVLYHYRARSPSGWENETRLTQPLDLSICILTTLSRRDTVFAKLVEKLAQRAEGKPVEILGLLDNSKWSMGAKRNALMSLVQGRYICFVDDDDDVTDEYVDALLGTIRGACEPDCIVFDAWVTVDGKDGILCHYGVEFHHQDTPEGYHRIPSHICCFRRELVQYVPFRPVDCQEDVYWSAAVRSRLQRQTRVPRILYHYRTHAETAASGQLTRSGVNRLGPALETDTKGTA